MLQLTRFTLPTLLLSALLSACGGGSDKSSGTTESTAATAELPSEQQAIDANRLKQIPFTPQRRQLGKVLKKNDVANAQLFNTEAFFRFPKSGYQFNGNVTAAFRVTDPEGINRVLLRFDGSESALVICEVNCGTEFDTLVTGISPQLFGLDSGQHNLTIWVEDETNTEAQFASVTVDWHKKVMSGVAVQLSDTTGELNVSWDANPDVLRYNVYLAEEPGHNGKNVEQLSGGDARLSLTETSTRFPDKAPNTNYYLLITGTDQTGESAYSDEIALINAPNSIPPQAVNDSVETNEDTTVSGNLIDNDLIPKGATVTLVETPIDEPSQGTVKLFSDGRFEYTPQHNYYGTDQFQYQIINAEGLTSNAFVDISITPVDDAPNAQDDSYVFDGTSLTIEASGMLANDEEPDGEALTITITSPPEFGAVTLNQDGSFTYTPGDTFTTFDAFTYSITDLGGKSATARVTLETPDKNGIPPIAHNDEYELLEDEELRVAVADSLLLNDKDQDSATDRLVVADTTSVTHGKLELDDDGTFTYQPNPNFFGTDTFIYSIKDPEGNTAEALVTLTVLPVNDAPVANGDMYRLSNDRLISIPAAIGVLKNDSDPESSPVQVVTNSLTQPQFGTVTLLADGGFSYQAEADFVGTDSFTYTISDGTLQSPAATVQIDVVQVHAETNDVTEVTIELASLSEHIPTGATLISANAASGTVTANSSSITYSPTYSFDGIDEITLTFSSGAETFNFILAIQVARTNQAPEFTSSNALSVDENTQAGEVFAQVSATDPEQHTINYALIDATGTFIINSETGELSVGADQSINFEDRSSYDLTVSASDEFGLSSLHVITLAVNDVNEAPNITSESTFEIAEHASLELQLEASDEDGNSLAFELSGDDAALFALEPGSGELAFISAPNFESPLDADTDNHYQVTITVSDDADVPLSTSQAITVLVVDANDLPGFTSATSASVPENQTTALTVEATDEDGDNLAFTLSGSDAAHFVIDSITGEIQFITAADFESPQDANGDNVYQFDITVTDAQDGSQTQAVTISVENENEAPVFTSSSTLTLPENTAVTSLVYTATATDPDMSDSLSFHLMSGADSFGLDATSGDLVVINNAALDFETNALFEVALKVEDASGATGELALTVQLTDINEAPVILGATQIPEAVAENDPPSDDLQIFQFDVNDPDAGDSLSWTFDTAVDSRFSLDPSTGDIAIKSGASFDFETQSEFEFSLRVTDSGGLVDTITTTLAIADVNETPIATDDSASVENYSSVTIDALVNDTDPDGDTLTISEATALAGSVEILAGNQIHYTPNFNITADTISYTVTDGELSHSASIAVTVTPIALIGVHDINQDGVDDLTVSHDTEAEEILLIAHTNVDTLFRIASDTYFPVEKALDDRMQAAHGVAESSEHYGAVIDGKLHTINFLALQADAELQYDPLGEVLSTSANDLSLPASFVEGYEVWAGENVNQAFRVDLNQVHGASIELDSDGSGRHVNETGITEFTWTASGNKLTATIIDPDTYTLSYTAQELFDLGAISQTQLDDYVSEFEDASQSLDVSASDLEAHLRILDNQAIYLTVKDTQKVQLILPEELGSLTVVITKTGENFRIYDKARLATFPIQGFTAGEYVTPYVEYSDGVPHDIVAELASFNSDGTGGFHQREVSFTWLIDENGKLNLTTDTGLAYTLTQTRDNEIEREVLFEAVNSSDQQRFSRASIVLQDMSPADSDVETAIRGNFLTSAFTLEHEESYNDNGELIADFMMGFSVNETTSELAPEGESDALKVDMTDVGFEITDWTWQQVAEHVDIRQYVKFGEGVTICDPSSDANCVLQTHREWQVVSVDETQERVWVLESQITLDYSLDPEHSGQFSYLQDIAPRLNYYQFNDLANALDDSLTVDEDDIAANFDALANDTDSAGGNSFQRLIGGKARNGMISTNDDLTLNYAPNPNFNGADVITYFVLDAFDAIGFAQISADVTPINDAPIANSDHLTLMEGGSVIISPLDNDLDIEDDPITLVSIGTPEFGSLNDNLDGTYTYIHDATELPLDQFTYTISDGEATGMGTVFVNIAPVNDAPTLSSITIGSNAIEDTLFTYDVQPHAADVDDDVSSEVSWSLTDAPAGMSIDSNGLISWTPLEGVLTSGTVTVSVADGGEDGALPASTTFSINVIPVNDAPILSSFSIDSNAIEDTLFTYDVQPHAFDVDDDITSDVTWSITGAPTGMTIDANGVISWTPTEGELTSGTVTVSVADGGEDGTLPASTTFSINVTPVNDAPTLSSISIDSNAIEDTRFTYDVKPHAADVDDDISSDVTWALTGAPTGMTIDANGVISWTPTEGVLTSGTVTVSVTDGGEDGALPASTTFSINVTPVNDAPTLSSISIDSNAIEDARFTYDVKPHAADVDDAISSDVTWALTGAPTGMTIDANGVISWTPTEGVLTSGTVTVSVADGGEDGTLPASTTFNINVTPVNDAPTLSSISIDSNAIEDTLFTYDAQAHAADVDDDVTTDVTWSLTGAPTGMSIDTNGLINWTPLEGVLTSGTVTVSVADGGEDGALPASTTFSVNVTPVNDAPTLSSISIGTNAIEDTLFTYSALAHVSDVDDDINSEVTWSLNDAPAGMTIDSVGLISWTPTEGVITSGTVTVSVADGGEDGALPASTTFSINVTPVNDAPTLSSISIDANATEDTLFTYDARAHAADVDNDITSDVTWSLIGAPTGMTIDANGLISWTPTEGILTSGTVTVSVADGGEDGALPATTTFSVNVTPVNDAPTLSSISVGDNAIEDTLFTYDARAHTADVDDDITSDVTWSLTGAPTGMTIDANGLISWTPTEGILTSNTVTVSVADGGEDGALPASTTFSINVTPVNDAPTLSSFSISDHAIEDTLFTYDVQQHADDVDDELSTGVTWSLTDAPTGMSINTSGVISWTPTEGILTSGTVTVSVADGGEDGAIPATTTFSVNVTPVNDAPTLSTISIGSNAIEDTLFTYDIKPHATDVDDDVNTEVTWSLTGAPTGMSIDSNGVISWTPLEGDLTSGTVTVTIADGGEDGALPASTTFSVNVTPVNDAPTLSSFSIGSSATEDTLFTYDVQPHADDVDDEISTGVTWSLTDAPTGMSINTSGVISWTPLEGELTSGTVTVSVADGGEDGALPASTTFSISVTAVNDGPTLSSITIGDNAIEDIMFTYDIKPHATDVDDDVNSEVTWSLTGAPTGMTIDANGLISWTPTEGVLGSGTVTVSIADGGEDGALPASTTFSVNVTPVNDAPTLSTINIGSNAIEDTLFTYDVQPHADDVDDEISTGVTWSLTDAPTGMSINTSGVISWTPTEGVLTSGTVTVSVADGGEDGASPASTTFVVNVTAVNDAPTITSATTASPTENQLAVLDVEATDVDNDTLTYSLSGADVEAFLIDSETGVITFESLQNFESPGDADEDNVYHIDVTVTDDGTGNLTDTQSLTITLNDAIENTELQLVQSFADNGLNNFNSFSDNAKTVTTKGDFVLDAKRDDNGNYMLLTRTDKVFTISKIKPDGTLDLTFGNQGRKYLDYENLTDVNVQSFDDQQSITEFFISRLVLDTDSGSSHYNKIYLLGYQKYSDEMPILLRLKPDGNIDTSFSADGKFEKAFDADASLAYDLLLHSDGAIYLAVNTEPGQGSRSFKLIKLNTSGSEIDSTTYNLTASQSDEEDIIGITENSSGEIVAFGSVKLTASESNILMARLDKDDFVSTPIIATNTFDSTLLLASEDLITSHLRVDSNHIVLGGSSDLLFGNKDMLLAKVNINNLTLDTSFDSDGLYVDDLSSSSDDAVFDISVNSSGEISFISILDKGANDTELVASQVSSGGILTSVGNLFMNVANHLTGTSGGGVTNETDVRAVILQDVSDTSDSVTIFSNFEQDTPSGDKEVEVYLKTFDNEGNELTRFDYEFSPVETTDVAGLTVTGDDFILTLAERDNEVGQSAFGYTLTKHGLTDGTWQQDFAIQGQLDQDGEIANSLLHYGGDIIELNDGTYLLITVTDNNGAFDLWLRQYDTNGSEKTDAGFPKQLSYSKEIKVHGVDYNTSLNKVAIVGHHDTGANQDGLFIKVEVSDGSILLNNTYDVFGSSTSDLLSDLVLHNDGTATLLGDGLYPGRSKTDAFLVRIDNTGSLDSSFDGDAGDGDDVLKVEFNSGDTTDTYAEKLAELSDGDFVVAVTTDNNQSQLMKVIEDSGNAGQYLIDTSFDSQIDGTDSDDSLTLKMNSIAPFGTADIWINDMLVDTNDNLILVGQSDFSGHKLGFMAKLDGQSGTYDSTFGQLTQPGYFVPGGRTGCDPSSNATLVDVCDVSSYRKVAMISEGSYVISSIVTGPEGQKNVVLLRMTEQQDDVASSYTVNPLFLP